MGTFFPKILTLLLLGSAWAAPKSNINHKVRDEQAGEDFMKELDARFSQECNLEMKARWEYIVDVLDPMKEEAAKEAAVRYLNFKGEAALNSSLFDYSGYQSIDLYRKFRFLSKQGPGALESADLTEYKDHQSKMETTYSSATICDYYEPTKCDLALEPDVEFIMANSENWDELRYVWDQWREVSGKLMKEDFIRFVELSNKAATLDGFADTSMFWLNGYTVDDREADSYAGANPLSQNEFKDMVDDVWQQVSEALYKKLHSWVRWRMSNVYPEHIDLTGPMPANILGNMWAQDWVNVADHVMPFQEFPSFDVSESMVENGWDIQQMFNSAQNFFESISLFPMTPIFWEKSVINQTAWGKIMLCHASAEDFCLGSEGNDYRIKMCTEVNMEDLVTVHHEMGHIEYFMAYKNQPHVFRESANPGFHEAIGDLIALSVSTPSHMENVLHLSPSRKATQTSSKYTDDEKRDLNFLMRMALEKIAFLPFGYLIDKFRWGVFDGSIPIEEMNAGWWDLRENLQGVTPPGEPRGEEFFDAGAKYHVPANVPYIRYFVSFIVQFQFHAHLCEVAGHTGPLHTCDIYNNTEAGTVLKEALSRGFSEPWPIILQDLGGSLDMDPQAIVSYFDPLIQFLDEELLNAGQCIGWGDDCITVDLGVDEVQSDNKEFLEDDPSPTTEETTNDPSEDTSTTDELETTTEDYGTTTTDPTSEDEAKKDMEDMDTTMTDVVHKAVFADWRFQIDLVPENKNRTIIAWQNVKKSFKDYYEPVLKHYDYSEFKDPLLKRQFELQQNLGVAALEDGDLSDLTGAISEMVSLYGEKVCPVSKKDCKRQSEGIDFTEVQSIMADSSQSFKDRSYYWEQWRKVSSKEMLGHYKDYISLENKAAKSNSFNDTGDMWLDPYLSTDYNTTDFRNEIALLWNKTKPLYQKLHAYVLYNLKDHHKKDIDDDEDLIPAHLLGDMTSENWENLYDLMVPYPEDALPDITPTLADNFETPKEMAYQVEEFFGAFGLYPMTTKFWTNSIFDKKYSNMSCQASAWDFYDVFESRKFDTEIDGDFRIKMCAGVNQEDFIKMHHEMSHVNYMIAYSKQKKGLLGHKKMPLVFRDGANPAFHEAVSNTIGLTVSSPSYLEMVNETLTGTNGTVLDLNDNMTVNFLMKTALSKIAVLPYAYALDAWRWEVFHDNNAHDDLNKRWWTWRIKEQGVAPPMKRYPETDFDAGSKYDVAVSSPYIWRFVAHILQFQFHDRLCIGNRTVDPLYDCTLADNPEGIEGLKDMMALGRTKHWQDVLEEFLGTRVMDAQPLLEYFEPLDKFLTKFLKEHGIESYGWDEDQIDKYMDKEIEEISATVPIIVGIVLAVMVLIVIIAYFVGQKKQSKKRKALKAQQEQATEMGGHGDAKKDDDDNSSHHSGAENKGFEDDRL